MSPTLRSAMALAVVASAFAVHAATPAPAAEAGKSDTRAAQQSRMKTCSADAKAKGLKGDERKAFMGECLRKKA